MDIILLFGNLHKLFADNSLFDDDQILRAYVADVANTAAQKAAQEAAQEATQKAAQETARENAMVMLKNGRISVEEIPNFFPNLTANDARELEAEVMQLA